MPQLAPQLGAPDMPVDSLMEYERIWVAGLNRGDASVADRTFLPDCIVHITGVPEPLRGIDSWKKFIAGILKAFPDFHLTIEDQLVQGDLVAFRWHATGTHTGPLGPAPATGKRVAIDGLIIDRVVGGKVEERWEQFDQSLMLQQLGFA
jgi:predicted ester cyclase